MHTLYERGSVFPFHSRSVVTGSTLQAGTAPGELLRAYPRPRSGSHDSGRFLVPGRAVLRPSEPCADRCPRRLHRQVEWTVRRVRRQARDWVEARAARPETEATDGLVARRLGSSQRLPGDDGHGVQLLYRSARAGLVEAEGEECESERESCISSEAAGDGD